MIIMLCGECQMNMYLNNYIYSSEGGNKYRIDYVVIDENNHVSRIRSNIKEYKPDSAEARLIQSLIEKDLRSSCEKHFSDRSRL